MSKNKILFAVDEEQKLIALGEAKKGCHYYCPACQKSLVLRKGNKNSYFVHYGGVCNHDTILHQTAKQLIKQTVTDWKLKAATSPILKRQCRICDTDIEQPLPDKVEMALIDCELPNGKVIDVALIAEGQAIAAVLIQDSQIENEQSNQCKIPFIVVNGGNLIQNPQVWRPTIDKFRPLVCKTCLNNFRKFEQKVSQIAQNTGVTTPASYYRYGICQCWKCGQEILAFAWPEHGLHTMETPKQAPPSTVQYRFSKTAGHKYWVNTCPYCHMIQGDFYLHGEPDGPFFSVSCDEDTDQAFKDDLLKIASYASYLGLFS